MRTKRLSPGGDGESSDKPSDFGPTELVELNVHQCRWLRIFAYADGLENVSQEIDRLIRNQLGLLVDYLGQVMEPVVVEWPDVAMDPLDVRRKRPDE